MTREPRSFTRLSVAGVYDEVASRYDEWIWQRFWRRNERPLVDDLLRQHHGARTLDVGIGTGAYVTTHRDTSDLAVGIDISVGMLAILRARWPSFPVVAASATSLPFASQSFDTILATRVLSHIENLVQFFDEANRVLSDRGRIVVSDLDSEHDYEAIRFSELEGSTRDLRLRPIKHSLVDLTLVAGEHGFRPTHAARIRRGELRWDPGVDAPASLGRGSHAPVFYTAAFVRG